MNKKKEILILIAGNFSILAIIALVVTVIVFQSFFYLVVVIVCFYVLQVLLSFYLLNSRRIVNVKMCWIFVILGLPVFGFFLFVIFGINPLLRFKRKDYLSRQASFIRHEDFDFTNEFLNEESEKNDLLKQIFYFGVNSQRRPVYCNNEVFVVQNQKNLYHESLKLIEKAKHFIHLQYYIISDGVWLRSIANALIEKVKQGVKVRFIYDWVGTYKRGAAAILKELKEAGVLIGEFNPATFTRYTSKTNFRCHRKCLIVDNVYALYGGSNLADEYIRYEKWFNNWEDSNVIISGHIVNTLNIIFCLDWLSYCGLSKDQRNQDDLLENRDFYLSLKKPELVSTERKVIAQIVESSPGYNEKTLHDMLISLFAKAKSKIKIITPYFVPTEGVLTALRTASLSGIDVQIILPGMPDDKAYILTMNRFQYEKLIDADIRIYEYQGFIHSKTIMIDDDVTVVSTFNLDFRSLFINYESALIVKDSETVKNYTNIFNNLISQSTKITPKTFSKHQKRIIKWKMAFMNIYHPLL
ncbi:cardiolipin synthase [[Mycoplasma] testudinis]|uniref:cardiolipin synthase n=1 Tax=[Mycoplasma] testudinis TaxID=33924 RepID=UPI00048A347F|nr:cardiolipin synthase [[Mycoplasma] testudinis]